MSQHDNVDWQGMDLPGRALALHAVYLDPRYHFRPGEMIDLKDGRGRVWMRLATRNFRRFATEVSGLTISQALMANNWLIGNGLACTKGVGSGSTHYVRERGTEPETTK